MTSEVTGGAFTERLFDGMGRAYKVSAPTGSGETAIAWTTTTFDALGRPVRVETSEGAATVTSYNNNQATVTDPAGNARRTVNDGGGRLTSVVENATAATAAQLTTAYTYGDLDTLATVTQGTQTREAMTLPCTTGNRADSCRWILGTF